MELAEVSGNLQLRLQGYRFINFLSVAQPTVPQDCLGIKSEKIRLFRCKRFRENSRALRIVYPMISTSHFYRLWQVCLLQTDHARHQRAVTGSAKRR